MVMPPPLSREDDPRVKAEKIAAQRRVTQDQYEFNYQSTLESTKTKVRLQPSGQARLGWVEFGLAGYRLAQHAPSAYLEYTKQSSTPPPRASASVLPCCIPDAHMQII